MIPASCSGTAGFFETGVKVRGRAFIEQAATSKGPVIIFYWLFHGNCEMELLDFVSPATHFDNL